LTLYQRIQVFLHLQLLGLVCLFLGIKLAVSSRISRGGAQGTAQIAKTGGLLAENFESFLTLTPKADDPIFGESGFFAGIGNFFSNFKLPSLPPSQPPLTEAEQFDFSGLVGGVSPEPTGQPAPPFSDAAIFAQDFPEPFVPIAPTPESVTVAPSLLDQIIAPFTGGGVSFEGGTIFETPIENLSLSQIIDKFMVTASQAADIKAQAVGFTPEEQAFLGQGQEISPLGDIASMPAVTEGFEGLTPEQIFLQLVGGNISNF